MTMDNPKALDDSWVTLDPVKLRREAGLKGKQERTAFVVLDTWCY
jgi:hypothetical protein